MLQALATAVMVVTPAVWTEAVAMVVATAAGLAEEMAAEAVVGMDKPFQPEPGRPA